jgi:2-polyprenyl-3-methyl-5-hydroxy-6-metoxy-1,4-benzoquinol methylase
MGLTREGMTMELEAVGCYICGSRRSSPWGAEGDFTMVKCGECGLVYLNPRPAAHEIDEAARTGLHKAGPGTLNAIGRYSAKKVAAYRAKLTPLLSHFQHQHATWRWLDIGAGFGELVEALQALSPGGSAIRGIEPCEPKVHKARSKGLAVTSQPLSTVRERFTHVSLINVYSHLPDPARFLGDLHGIMVPGAFLLLVTGNGGDIPRNEFPGSLYLPDHLSFAGEKNLRTVLDDAGYDVITIAQHAESPTLDSVPVAFAKNVARRLTGRPPVPRSLPSGSRFRSLWIVARRRSTAPAAHG